jgi:hypothetical protein
MAFLECQQYWTATHGLWGAIAIRPWSELDSALDPGYNQ